MLAFASTGMTALDWLVIALYGIAMLAIGAYYMRGNRTTDDYLLGGRTMRVGSIGLSLFATLFSTITYLGMPGEMISKGPVILCWLLGIPIIYVVGGYLVIPRFAALRGASAYAMLEQRLGMSIRLMGSCMFLLTRLFWMALIINVTAEKVIVRMMNWNASATPWVSAAIGLLTVIYSSMGGMRAVVLTDVIQSLILFAAALAAIVLITGKLGGIMSWMPTEWSPHWDSQPLFSFDPTVRVTVVGSVVFMLVWWISTSGSDQMAIQRYLSMPNMRAARRAFLITLLSNAAVTFVLGALGFALLAFFRAYPQPGMTIERNADDFLTYYIVHFLPPGVTGLVLAGLLAAAMSSLSSGINSSGAVISADFIERFRPAASEADRMRIATLLSWCSGLAAVLLSLFIGMLGQTKNIMELTARTNHVFVAPLFALFVMAIFVPYSTPTGAAVGTLAACGVAVLIAFWDLITGGPTLSFQWISLVALAVHLSVGCTISRLQQTRRSTRADQPTD